MKLRLPAATVALVLLGGGARSAGRAGRSLHDGRDLEDHDPRPRGRQRRVHRAQEQVDRARRDRRLAAVGDERERLVADRARHDHGRHGTGRRRGLPAHEQPGRADRRQPDLLDRHLRRRRPAAALERGRDVPGRRRRQRVADRAPRSRSARARSRTPGSCSRPPTATTPSSARPAARRTPTTTTPTSSARTTDPTPSCPKDAQRLHEDHRHPDARQRRQPALRRPDRHQDPRHRHRRRRSLRLELRLRLPLRRGPLGPAGHA